MREVLTANHSAQNASIEKSYTGIMQPYFFPYLGYFQLIDKCKDFVLYDDIQYTKKGWVNRNKLLENSDWTISVNCNSSSVKTTIKEKTINENFDPLKILRRIRSEYSNSNHLSECMDFLEGTLMSKSLNLFDYLYQTITSTMEFLQLRETKVFTSSDLASTKDLQKEEKIFALMDAIGTKKYLNPVSGTPLYEKKSFLEKEKELYFLSPKLEHAGTFYDQSIIHLLLTLGKTETQKLIQKGSITEA